MKILIAGALFFFFAVVVAILITGLTISQKGGQNNPSNQTLDSNADNTAGQNNNSIAKIFTESEVAGHNNADSCWMIIHDKVYDVTSLIPTHTGGSEAILKNCGKDGTIAFDTKYGKGSHSDSAKSILDSYYIGNLK